MTTREQILSAILTNLKTITGIDPDDVVRSRTFPVGDDRLPFISLMPIVDPRREAVTGGLDSSLKIKISLWVQGDVPDSVADPIIEQIDEKMLADRTLGVAGVMDVTPLDVSFEFDEGNKPEVQVDLEFLIQYRTILTF